MDTLNGGGGKVDFWLNWLCNKVLKVVDKTLFEQKGKKNGFSHVNEKPYSLKSIINMNSNSKKYLQANSCQNI